MAKFNKVTAGQTEVCINRSTLTFLRTVRIAAQPAITTSEEYFKEAGLVWMGKNFKAQFLGLEVPATQETEFAVRRLEQDLLDAPILAELGDKAEISVSQLQVFLNACRGFPEWFIFYPKGKLWAVEANWSADVGGWSVRAHSVGSLFGWARDRQVVSQV